MRVFANNVENLGKIYVTAKIPTRIVIPTTIDGYLIACVIPILSFKSCAIKSASWKRTWSSTPALSPALIMLTNMELKTFGCLRIDFERESSLFLKNLIKKIQDRQDFSLVLREVNRRTSDQTNGNQNPWSYNSLGSDNFVLSKLR